MASPWGGWGDATYEPEAEPSGVEPGRGRAARPVAARRAALIGGRGMQGWRSSLLG